MEKMKTGHTYAKPPSTETDVVTQANGNGRTPSQNGRKKTVSGNGRANVKGKK